MINYGGNIKANLKDFKMILEKNGIKANPKTSFENFSLMYDFARGRALTV